MYKYNEKVRMECLPPVKDCSVVGLSTVAWRRLNLLRRAGTGVASTGTMVLVALEVVVAVAVVANGFTIVLVVSVVQP